jgi:hypothetical protein
MVVGDLALGLERGDNRGAKALGQFDHRVAMKAGTVADDDHGAPGCGDQLQRAVERRRRRANLDLGQPPVGPGSLGAVGGRECLHLVREDQVGGALLEDRVLARERHQLGVLGGLEHGLGPARHLAEGGAEVDLLKRARTAIVRHAAGRPVSLPYAEAANAAAPSWRMPM